MARCLRSDAQRRNPYLKPTIQFWLGRNAHGQGLVYRADQYNPQIISNRGIEYEIGQMPDIEKATAFSYQQSGHTFYVLSFPESMRTYVYDASIQDPELAWHVRETYAQGRDRANCHVFAFRKAPGRRLCVKSGLGVVRHHIHGRRFADLLGAYNAAHRAGLQARHFRSLTINMERGVGLVSGHGSDPSIIWIGQMTADIHGAASARRAWARLAHSSRRSHSTDWDAAVTGYSGSRVAVRSKPLSSGRILTQRQEITDGN